MLVFSSVCVCVWVLSCSLFFNSPSFCLFFFYYGEQKAPFNPHFFTESINECKVCPPLPWKVKAINKDAKETSLRRLREKQ